MNSTKFIGNKANYFSNCIYVESNTFYLYFSLFSNNIPFGDYYLITQTSGRGGCIEALAKSVHITYSEFLNNSKSQGGSISLVYPFTAKIESIILISNCLFSNNSAILGGGISLSDNYQTDLIVKRNYFGLNFGAQSNFFVL